MSPMTGTFKLIKRENFEAYLNDIEFDQKIAEMSRGALPTMVITNEEDEWNIKTSTVLKTIEIKFKLGQEFDETTEDGRVCKSVITQEGENKLVQVQIYPNGITSTIVREFTDTEMKMTWKGPEVVATGTFTRQ